MAKNLTVQQRINKIEEILRREIDVIHKYTASNKIFKRYRQFAGFHNNTSYYMLYLENCRYKPNKLNASFSHNSDVKTKEKILSLIDKYIDK